MRKLATLSMKKAVIAGVTAAVLPASLLLIAPGLRGALFGTTGVAGVQETQTAEPATEPLLSSDSAPPSDSSRVPSDPRLPARTAGTAATGGSGNPGGASKPGAGGGGGGGGSGGGSGSAQNGSFEITGDVAGLYPGAELPLALKLENSSNNAIRVTRIQVQAASSDRAGCDSANIVTPAFADDPQTRNDDVVIPGNGETTATLTIGMVGDPSESCKNASWNLTYTGQAVKA